MIIYKITCKVNNKVYIGQTCEDINKRFRRHMGYQSLEHDTKFYRAVRKYGKENFYIEQIDSADTQDELDDKEIYWINYYDSAQNGYNTRTSKGKCGGDTLSNHPDKAQISKKLRQSKLGDKNPMRINGGLKGAKNGMYGKPGHDRKRCVAWKIDNPEEILDFECLKDLGKYFGFKSPGTPGRKCAGERPHEYKGYYLEFYEDYEKRQSTIES